MMHLQSLAWRTDIALVAAEATIIQRDDYCVVRSKLRDDHIWKNYILFKDFRSAPNLGALMEIHELEFPGRARAFAIAFGWDINGSNTNVESELISAHFQIDRRSEFVAMRPKPSTPLYNTLNIREVRSRADWDRVVERRISILCNGRFPGLQAKFEIEKFEAYRRMVEHGNGNWFLGLVDGQEVGDMGIFVVEGNIARFQEVLVYPEFRNQGIGKAISFACCEEIVKLKSPTEFVVVADDQVAQSVYLSLGFRLTGVQLQACWTIYSELTKA